MSASVKPAGQRRRSGKSIRQMNADLEGIERLIAMQLSLIRAIRKELQGYLEVGDDAKR